MVQLEGIGGEVPVFREKGLMLSLPDAIAWALRNRYMGGEANGPNDDKALDQKRGTECGGEIKIKEG
ncbi:hypothetical protein [Oceanidesulfovibrio marinus]|uniref:hypothetical protein n=1 Tax=Oceanidesulfovibrio marinus TaxID=370038 RepID=UPI0011849F06|nr:hypothetical protein [Oceanidesulfovibrio marinus]